MHKYDICHRNVYQAWICDVIKVQDILRSPLLFLSWYWYYPRRPSTWHIPLTTTAEYPDFKTVDMNKLFSYLWFSLWLMAIFFTVISHLRFIYFKSDETVFSNDMSVATLLMNLWCFLPFYINSFKVRIFSCSSQWNMSCRWPSWIIPVSTQK
jgi:hypothetical protein